MRRWRIFFSGFLKETSGDTPDIQTMIYVKFSLLWRSASDIYDNTSDMNESNVLESTAMADWKSLIPPINKLFSAVDFYGQAGVIMGMVHIENELEDYEIYLFGEKMRCLSNMSNSKKVEFSHTLGYVHKNGAYVHFGEANIENIAKDLNFGFLVKPNTELRRLDAVNVSREAMDNGHMENFKGTLMAGRSYSVSGFAVQQIAQINNPGNNICISLIKFYFDGKKGRGILIKGKSTTSSSRKMSDYIPFPSVPEYMFPMVVAFTEDLCQLPEITGGKGSSLGKLTKLSSEVQKFRVPSGIVVTTSSYKELLTDDIKKEISNLENVLYGNIEGDTKEACKRVQDKIIATSMPNNIRTKIAKNLIQLFGEEYVSRTFAVRSSATGEDTEQMSAAGQMDTFLGVKGLDNILLSVKKCWASQFGFIAVQYKRRYGQPLNSPMAVVIQEMVSCDIAGVIFTCDPVSGNSTKISIAANYGLGESVVSGSEEPDVVELARDYKDDLKIHRMTVGSKSHKIIATDSGTKLEDLPEDERKECCLSSERALELGKISIKIEKHYRSRRDIEWGIKNEILYIFQSRPVTSGTQETDFEIEHEFDAALRVENDHFSVSNTGEVLPGAVSPLFAEVFFRTMNILFLGDQNSEWQGRKAKYFPTGWLCMCHHVMFNIADIFRKNMKSETRDHLENASMIAFFGRIIDNEELFEITFDRHSEEPTPAQFSGLKTIIRVLMSGRRLEKAKKFYSTYRIPVENYKTSEDLINAVLADCCCLKEVMACHVRCSLASTFWNMLILSTLSEAKGDIDEDVYIDFANLITNKGDVESADIPTAMQSLAFQIKKSIKPEEFKAMKIEDALSWLKSTSAPVGKKFREFLKKHGHRCLKELDFYSVPWGTDPKPLVKTLQSLVGNIEHDAEEVRNSSISELISQLKVNIGLLSKLKLMLFVYMSRGGIQLRECSKSMMIKGLDAWRSGYRALAKLMVSEGRLPDEDILFFMTLEELEELIKTRSPKILAKAFHRQKLFPKMDEYRFPEIMKGFPKPINFSATEEEHIEGELSMKGIPVSQGVAKGYLRVAISLDEAAELKPGEILLAYSTDIGWSPYFPTLAGVVTELGGLISHGAVVSREYGLPCIAGLHGATRKFRTGDYVLLDGNKGILQRISQPKEEN